MAKCAYRHRRLLLWSVATGLFATLSAVAAAEVHLQSPTLRQGDASGNSSSKARFLAATASLSSKKHRRAQSPWTCPDPPTGQVCEDSPLGWFDSEGALYDCPWYGTDPAVHCTQFGDFYERNGETANTACCACCGGAFVSDGTEPTFAPVPVPTSAPVVAPTPVAEPPSSWTCPEPPAGKVCEDSPLGWFDSEGSLYDCPWYGTNPEVHCSLFGDLYQRDGETANTACCVCCGGVHVDTGPAPTLAPVPDPTLAPVVPITPAPVPDPTPSPVVPVTPAPVPDPTDSPVVPATPAPVPLPTPAPESPTEWTCPEPPPGQICEDSPLGWFDSEGSLYDCPWYGTKPSVHCAQFGDLYERDGETANTACCACCGGVFINAADDDQPTPTPAPVPEPTPSPVAPEPWTCPQLPAGQVCLDSPDGWFDSEGAAFDCSWYASDPAMHCSMFGNSFERDGETANTACCACCGGQVVDSPSQNGEFNVLLDLQDDRGNQPWMTKFDDAKSRLEQVIVGDLPDVSGIDVVSNCGQIPESFDDVYLCGIAQDYDGLGGVLGYAQVLASQTLPTGREVSAAGNMVFDTADIDSMLSSGILLDVVLHEMLHVLGIGLLWTANGLRFDESYKESSMAQVKWNEMGCSGRVPIELDGGSGTRGNHWDERCMGTEIMTGYLGGGNKLSAITLGSLADMGYTVDYSQADPFTISMLGTCKASYCPEAPNTERRLGGREGKKAVSQDGLKKVKKYAAKQLSKARKGRHRLPEGLTWGGDSVTVFFEEAGDVHALGIEWEDVESECFDGEC